MIVSLTPNPSIDRTVTMSELRVGAVNRSHELRQDPGGKGVNVSRALSAHGAQTVAVMPLGGPEGAFLSSLLTEARVPVRSVPVAGRTRINLTIAADDGITTKINETGPHVDVAESLELTQTAVSQAGRGGWVLGAGSLAPGMSLSFYADLITVAHENGVRVAVDSSGQSMITSVRALPDLIKPNHHELGEIVGRNLLTLDDVVQAARSLTQDGIGTVVVSLGGSGALAVTETELIYACAPKVRPLSTVGAGDALLAGFLLADVQGRDLQGCLCTGVQFGAAAVQLPGSVMPGPSDIERVTVTLSQTPDLEILIEE